MWVRGTGYGNTPQLVGILSAPTPTGPFQFVSNASGDDPFVTIGAGVKNYPPGYQYADATLFQDPATHKTYVCMDAFMHAWMCVHACMYACMDPATHKTSKSASQPASQSQPVSQPVGQSASQPARQTDRQTDSQSVSQPVSQSASLKLVR